MQDHSSTEVFMKISGSWQASAGSTVTALSSDHASWQADVPVAQGGAGDGPDPHDLLDSALVACTILTLQIYAKRRGYPLAGVRVEVEHNETPGLYRMQRAVHLEGDLTAAMREDLMRVANKCPIHKVLSGKIEIETRQA
jgi:putative redox protein